MKTTAASPAIVTVEIDDRIAYVTMRRPEKRNALSFEMMEQLVRSFRDVGRNDGVAVAVLAGEGPAFSSGHDLAELRNRDIDFYRREFDLCTALMETIQGIRQPVIAQVHAPATAAGCQLVASCDLAIAAEEAWFAMSGVKIGLFCTTPMVALTRAIGRKKAMELLLTGEPMNARDALAAGLLNHVVPAAKLGEAVRSLARQIMNASDYVIALGKDAFYRQIDLPQAQAYDFAEETMAINAKSPDAREGITAFLEKRAPDWRRDGKDG
ncbi:MAG TPA: enoyl-CoA hydratase [Candidatus Eremiobacteraceae bacterium]|nr:enoyl-CoA hydratase [Candidatus Eremiobacteraceae bacterium]